jgi:hypothetical protein
MGRGKCEMILICAFEHRGFKRGLQSMPRARSAVTSACHIVSSSK